MIIKPQRGLAAIKPYVPGKPIEEVQREYGLTDVIKLASNENPLGPSPKVVAALHEALPGLNFYPDAQAYRADTGHRGATWRGARYGPRRQRRRRADPRVVRVVPERRRRGAHQHGLLPGLRHQHGGDAGAHGQDAAQGPPLRSGGHGRGHHRLARS